MDQKCRDCGRLIDPDTGDCPTKCKAFRRPRRIVQRSQKGARPRAAVDPFTADEHRKIIEAHRERGLRGPRTDFASTKHAQGRGRR